MTGRQCGSTKSPASSWATTWAVARQECESFAAASPPSPCRPPRASVSRLFLWVWVRLWCGTAGCTRPSTCSASECVAPHVIPPPARRWLEQLTPACRLALPARCHQDCEPSGLQANVIGLDLPLFGGCQGAPAHLCNGCANTVPSARRTSRAGRAGLTLCGLRNIISGPTAARGRTGRQGQDGPRVRVGFGHRQLLTRGAHAGLHVRAPSNVWWLVHPSSKQVIAAFEDPRFGTLRELPLPQCMELWGTQLAPEGNDAAGKKGVSASAAAPPWCA